MANSLNTADETQCFTPVKTTGNSSMLPHLGKPCLREQRIELEHKMLYYSVFVSWTLEHFFVCVAWVLMALHTYGNSHFVLKKKKEKKCFCVINVWCRVDGLKKK